MPRDEGLLSSEMEEDDSSAFEEDAPDGDRPLGPEDEDFFLQNADPQQLANAEALQTERANELVNTMEMEGKQEMSEGMRVRIRRCFKAQAKQERGIELTKTDVKDLEWFEQLQIGEAGEVFLQRKKKQRTWEQAVAKQRKEHGIKVRREARRKERDERREAKQALEDERKAVSAEKRQARVLKEQGRVERRRLRDEARAGRNWSLVKTKLSDEFKRRRERFMAKQAKAIQKLERAKKNNRCKAVAIPQADDTKLMLKIHMPNSKLGKKRPRPAGMGVGAGGTFRSMGEVGPDGVPIPIGFRNTGEVRINFSAPGKRSGTRNSTHAAAEMAKADGEHVDKSQRIVIVPVNVSR